MTATAAGIKKTFLLLFDSVSALAPPNVNEGAEPTIAGEGSNWGSTGFSKRASAAALGSGLVGAGSSTLRAGAGALAAPLVAEGALAVKSGLGATGAGGAGDLSV